MAHPFASKIFAKAEKMASLGVVEADELAELAVFLASPEAAKRAFRKRAKALHPDKRPDDPRAQQRFVELQRALDEVPPRSHAPLLVSLLSRVEAHSRAPLSVQL